MVTLSCLGLVAAASLMVATCALNWTFCVAVMFFTVSFGSTQSHVTEAVFTGPANKKTVLTGQVVVGTGILTCAVSPASRVPLAGLYVNPFIPLLGPNHCRP